MTPRAVHLFDFLEARDPHDDDVGAGFPATLFALGRDGSYGRRDYVRTEAIPASVVAVLRAGDATGPAMDEWGAGVVVDMAAALRAGGAPLHAAEAGGRIIRIRIRCEDNALGGREIEFSERADRGWYGVFPDGSTPRTLRKRLRVVLGERLDLVCYVGSTLDPERSASPNALAHERVIRGPAQAQR